MKRSPVGIIHRSGRAHGILGERLAAGAPPLWRRLAPLVRRGLPLIVLLVGLAGGVWGFVEPTDEVIEGGTHAVEVAILLLLRNPADHAGPLGPPWVEELGRGLHGARWVGVVASALVVEIR